MKLGDGRAIKTTQWYPNEIFRDDDINVVGQATYQNITDQLALRFKGGMDTGKNLVVSGLNLVWSTLLTTNMEPGVGISPKGNYLASDTWGFIVDADGVFIAVVPQSVAVAFVTGGTFARIDSVEIRPIQTDYNTQNRNFKDPVTGIVTTAPIDTRIEYGYEFAVRKGDDTAALAKEQTVFTLTFTTVGSDVAGKYILFSTVYDDYYLWYNTGASIDPMVTGRTGLEVAVGAADDDDVIASKSSIALNTLDGITATLDFGEFTILGDTYANLTDATNGDMGALFAAIAITQGNGSTPETSGWIKIAEVNVGASATSISQSDIIGYEDSYLWNTNINGTMKAIAGDGDPLEWLTGKSYPANELVHRGDDHFLSKSANIGEPPEKEVGWKPAFPYYRAGETPTFEDVLRYDSLYQSGDRFTLPAYSAWPAIVAMSRSRIAFTDPTNDDLDVYDWNGREFIRAGGSAIATAEVPDIASLGVVDEVVYFHRTTLIKKLYTGAFWFDVGTALTLALTAGNSAQIAAVDEDRVLLSHGGNNAVYLHVWDSGTTTWLATTWSPTITNAGLSAMEVLDGKYMVWSTAALDTIQLYKLNFDLPDTDPNALVLLDEVALAPYTTQPNLTVINKTDFAMFNPGDGDIHVFRIEDGTLTLLDSFARLNTTAQDLASMKGTKIAWTDSTNKLDMLRIGQDYSQSIDVQRLLASSDFRDIAGIIGAGSSWGNPALDEVADIWTGTGAADGCGLAAGVRGCLVGDGDNLIKMVLCVTGIGSPSTTQQGAGNTLGAITNPAVCALEEPGSDVVVWDATNQYLQAWSWTNPNWTTVGNTLVITGSGGLAGMACLGYRDIAIIDATTDNLSRYSWDGTNFALVGSSLNITGVTAPNLVSIGPNRVVLIDPGLGGMRVYRWNGTTWTSEGPLESVSLTAGRKHAIECISGWGSPWPVIQMVSAVSLFGKIYRIDLPLQTMVKLREWDTLGATPTAQQTFISMAGGSLFEYDASSETSLMYTFPTAPAGDRYSYLDLL